MVVGQAVANRIVGGNHVEQRRENRQGVTVVGRGEVGDPGVRFCMHLGCERVEG